MEHDWDNMTMTLTRGDGHVGTFKIAFDVAAGKLRVDRTNTEFPEHDEFIHWEPHEVVNYLVNALGDAVIRLIPKREREIYLASVVEKLVNQSAPQDAN